MVDRAHLVSSLAAHVEEELSSSVSLHWGAPLASLDAEGQVARFEGEGDGGEVKERSYDLLVACDGGNSEARRVLEEAGLIEVTQLPSPVSLTDYKTFHGECGAARKRETGGGEEDRANENNTTKKLTFSTDLRNSHTHTKKKL